MNEPFPAFKLDASKTLYEAIRDHNPVKVFALFSGGNDSTVLVAWARMRLLGFLDAAVFVDTGTALPGVREFVETFCAKHEVPLLVYEAGRDEYDQMVREHGFPGPASHRFAYVRLKERQIDALVRDHKTKVSDRIMLLTGVRRAESVRRMGTTAAVKRDGAQVWVAPLLDWTHQDMHDFRVKHDLAQSDVAALIHRSGECNCGAYAAPGEREDLMQLYPLWWKSRIAPLERETGCKWGDRSSEKADTAGPMCSDCQLRLVA